MGHAEDLFMSANLRQLLRDFLRGTAGDTGVHLIEDQSPDGLLLCKYIFECKHDPGQFAAGGNFGNGPQFLAHVGGH